ncbi:uncharacterized protein LY89DRAFT_728898 [Mollisia scopiformis]|uniref:BTB domain-containing protein n=1 Tax=Mollisia scopiformis TaxID=149040 RepID=A0A194XR70_MOLSC|nr:uncharacterized protein LY89DRAFT_728898 [Mollisia scopiformis]KUJ22785.1 hypothetical protein LY89DRAFT_728898 [Mollisia scopiformis]
MATQNDFSYGDDIVTIVVKNASDKSKDEHIPVHKRHACRYSPVLEKAFGIDQKKEYKFLDTTASAVSALVSWFYMQEVNLDVHEGKYACLDQRPFSRQLLPDEQYQKAKACKDEVGTLIDLWILGGELQIFKLQNNTMIKLLAVAKTCALSFGPFYTRVYAKTQIGSPLREFIVRLCAWSEDFHEFESRPHLFPQEMLFDLLRTYSEALPPNVASARRHEMQRQYMDFTVTEHARDPDEGREISLSEMLQKYPRPELCPEAVGWGASDPPEAQHNVVKTSEKVENNELQDGGGLPSRRPWESDAGSGISDFMNPNYNTQNETETTPAPITENVEEDLLGLGRLGAWGNVTVVSSTPVGVPSEDLLGLLGSDHGGEEVNIACDCMLVCICGRS